MGTYEQEKERREWYKAHGICYRCGQKDAQRGYLMCVECRTAQNERRRGKEQTAEQLAAQRERLHRLREERKAKGLCPKCGKHKPEDGYITCRCCRAKDAAAGRRNWAKKHGSITSEQRTSGWYCYHCSAELPEWRENKLCDSCLKALRDRAGYMREHIDYANHPYGRQAHADVMRIEYRRTNGEGV